MAHKDFLYQGYRFEITEFNGDDFLTVPQMYVTEVKSTTDKKIPWDINKFRKNRNIVALNILHIKTNRLDEDHNLSILDEFGDYDPSNPECEITPIKVICFGDVKKFKDISEEDRYKIYNHCHNKNFGITDESRMIVSRKIKTNNQYMKDSIILPIHPAVFSCDAYDIDIKQIKSLSQQQLDNLDSMDYLNIFETPNQNSLTK